MRAHQQRSPRPAAATPQLDASPAVRVETLAQAFTPDPGFSWVFPDSRTRTHHLRVLFEGTIRHAERVGGVASLDDGYGVGVWMPRDSMEIGVLDAARVGMLGMPFRIGLGAMRRLGAAEREGDELVRTGVDGDFAYLMALAVSPVRQGSGLGRRTVGDVERQARDAGHDVLALRTENLANVALYEHLGFSVTRQEQVPSSGLVVTAMAKPI